MNKSQVVFLIFSIIFLLLSVYNFYNSRLTFDLIDTKTIIGGNSELDIDPQDIYAPIIIFCDNFNSQIKKQNKISRNVNICSSIGYFAAFLIALVSIYESRNKTFDNV